MARFEIINEHYKGFYTEPMQEIFHVACTECGKSHGSWLEPSQDTSSIVHLPSCSIPKKDEARRKAWVAKEKIRRAALSRLTKKQREALGV